MRCTCIILILLLLSEARGSQILAHEPKLIYVQQIFRHGHREPMYQLKNNLSTIGSTGQLTKQGRSMHYILGQNLFKLYWHQLFAGTPHANSYSESKFYARSTNTNRTVESAYSQLLGIFQNVGKQTINDRDVPFSLPAWPNASRQSGDVYVKSPLYHPVPVTVEKGIPSPWNDGDFLSFSSRRFCPNQDKWIAQNIQNPNVIKMINDPSFQNAINIVSKRYKSNLTFWDIYKYYDNAICMHYEGRAVDSIWTNPGFTKTALDAIFNIGMHLKFFYQMKQTSVITAGFFNETYNHFKRVTKDQSGVQWVFYSGHDTSIAGLLVRMNMTSADCIYENYLKEITLNNQTDSCVVEYPQFASTLIFELYKYKNNTSTFKVRYNGYLRKIPFCDSKLECPIERYYEWFQGWRVKDVAKKCGTIDKYKKKARNYHLNLEIDQKKMKYLQNQLKHYKQKEKRYEQQLEKRRKMKSQFEELKRNLQKSELIRKQQKKAIESLKGQQTDD